MEPNITLSLDPRLDSPVIIFRIYVVERQPGLRTTTANLHTIQLNVPMKLSIPDDTVCRIEFRENGKYNPGDLEIIGTPRPELTDQGVYRCKPGSYVVKLK